MTFDQWACSAKGYNKTSDSSTISTSPERPTNPASVTATPQCHNNQASWNGPRECEASCSVTDGDRPDPGDNSPPENKWKHFISMCHYFQKFFRLSQPEIQILSDTEWDDERILKTLRQLYMAKRGKFKRWFSWWRLRAIQHVKVPCF